MDESINDTIDQKTMQLIYMLLFPHIVAPEWIALNRKKYFAILKGSFSPSPIVDWWLFDSLRFVRVASDPSEFSIKI